MLGTVATGNLLNFLHETSLSPLIFISHFLSLASPSHIRPLLFVWHPICRNLCWLLLGEQEQARAPFPSKSIHYTTVKWIILNIVWNGTPTYSTKSKIKPFMTQAHPATHPSDLASFSSTYTPANMDRLPFNNYLPYSPPMSFHWKDFALFNTTTSLNSSNALRTSSWFTLECLI